MSVEDAFWQTHWLTLFGWLAGVAAVAKMMRERRKPGNILAWFFLIGFVPLVGVGLFLLFGGRKYAGLAKRKRQVRELAEAVAERDGPRGALAGNTLRLHPNGEVALQALLREIANAQRSIYLTVYAWLPDRVGRAVLEALAEKAAAGVRVQCLVDALGSRPLKGKHVRELREAGGRFAWFTPVWSLRGRYVNLRNHRKAFIFDEQRAIVGGQNIDERFMGFEPSPERFVDYSVQVAGPAVAELLHDFVCDWCFATRDPVEGYRALANAAPTPCGSAEVEVIPSGPDTADDRVWELVANAVQQARESILAVTPYFVPDEMLLYSLLLRARAGCRVEVFLPLKSNQPLADLARSRYLRQLHAAGVHFWMVRGPTVHGKLLITDKQCAIFGSPNLDQRSFFLNYETALTTSHPPTIDVLTAWAERLRAMATPFAETSETEARWPRLLAEDATHLLEPLL
ncbi:MAG: phospholipase D-like domain-containing protein [Opitutales bacterium]